MAGADLHSDWKVRQKRVEEALSGTLARFTDTAPPVLREAMTYSLMAGGKRLRPLLVIYACEAIGGKESQAMPAACAIEMLHTYSLIHDDLPAMDDDDLRRGVPTCHKVYGDALAILAGDALQTLAFQCLAESYPGLVAAVLCMELARGAGATGMVGGQVLDLAAEGRFPGAPEPSLAGLESIHRHKTGALFRAALRMGAIAAWQPPAAQPNQTAIAHLDRYGRAFGLAFQIIDDLLDVAGSVAQTGKRVGKDADRGKLTYPALLGVNESRMRAEKLVAEAVEALEVFGEPASPLRLLARFVMDRDR